MAIRYDARRDARGWTVFDRWTGRAVVVARAAQVGLTYVEAEQLAERLNRRGPAGDRSILQ
jgi:hypothetical protein